ncbi:Signal peptidase complex catalytic subunit sec11 [Conoideocrella luteorostrata]|uniref:Signal peptidase complex catalytic subunit SEC11 n=1 Tax=Conoideocrella luteorostrata TaxID=1105319 RepID=A0AAJ0CG20_9HYPO|nr:Signal peptidase complex catalytic subunit sec11 [Conoideocrella luteorostrata]
MALLTRRAANQVLSTFRLVAFIFMAWKALAWASDSPMPIVVATSESMEPGFQRGDILFLWNRKSYIGVGDIAVLSFPTRKLPMVHRVVQTHFLPDMPDGFTQYILTKGDNNDANDAQLYPSGEGFASRKNVVGVVKGIVPFLGLPAIKINELFSRPTSHKIQEKPPDVQVPANISQLPGYNCMRHAGENKDGTSHDQFVEHRFRPKAKTSPGE